MTTHNPLLRQIRRSAKFHVPIIPFSAQEQFRQNVTNFIRSALMSNDPEQGVELVKAPPGLKKIAPYWYPYTTMTKMRWIGRELLEVVSTEFRDRSMEYYRYALESGVTTVNGKVAGPTTRLINGDRIENIVHRHEPPVTDTPVQILLHDEKREFIVVNKPGSIPVHASGRYYRNTLIEILVNDFGYKKCYPANRLDRLTSGLMIIPLSPECARALTDEFTAGTVKKEYIARVSGKFPDEEIVCEEPLLTVDRQMGLNIVHPEGKPAKTIFNLIRYDANTNSSVVKCEPQTGRSHQLRVHLQYLGYPIANDPVYSESRIWGEKVGRRGIDTTPTTKRSAPAPPPHLQTQTELQGSPESLSKDAIPLLSSTTTSAECIQPSASNSKSKPLPRETGEDIGMGSPVPLSAEAVGVITRLRNMKDEDEDWSRWRDVVFRAKGGLNPHHLVVSPPPSQNQRKRGGKATLMSKAPISPETPSDDSPLEETTLSYSGSSTENVSTAISESLPGVDPVNDVDSSIFQLTEQQIFEKISAMEPASDISSVIQSDDLYCPECYLPLHPDPKPEKLYIFLHARKYTTSLGAFETEMPDWAAEGWAWDQSRMN